MPLRTRAAHHAMVVLPRTRVEKLVSNNTRETSRGERDFYPYILNLNHAAFGSDQKEKSSGQFFPMRKKEGNEINISHIDSCVWRAFSRETGKEDTMRSKFF